MKKKIAFIILITIMSAPFIVVGIYEGLLEAIVVFFGCSIGSVLMVWSVNQLKN